MVVVHFGAAFAAGLAATCAVRRYARRRGHVSLPRAERWARQPVALLGGVALALAYACGVLLVGRTGQGIALLVCAGVLGAVGLVDDLRTLRVRSRLAAQVLTAVVMAAFVCRPAVFSRETLNIAMGAVWIVALTNAMNLLDNMDGAAAGTGAIAAAALGAVAVRDGLMFEAAVAASVAGATLAFLWYNRPPASIYLGDCGALFLGCVLAALAARVGWQRPPVGLGRLMAPAVALAVPIFDTLYVIVVRLASRRRIWEGGTDHTTHRLARRLGGVGRSVVVIYALGLCAAFAGVVAFSASSPAGPLAAGATAAVFAAVAIALRDRSGDDARAA
jgi:UDP-GlcNAc:undecaprenyl-phosphate/decaprenyl-phosphate GlcNAc-1-phosphate transferase